MHYDVIEIIEDFQTSAVNRKINVEVINLFKDKVSEPSQHFEISK